MTLNEKIVQVAMACIGTQEGTDRHKTILDIYNQYEDKSKRKYTVKANDPWCAAFVSAVFIAAGIPKRIPIECSCFFMKNMGAAVGMLRDPARYVPKPGDIVFYKWQGKNVVSHVGIVKSVEGSALEVIEGNYNNAVGIRKTKLSNPAIDSYLEVNYT